MEAVVHTRDQIDIFYGPPLSVLSDCLRGFIKAGPGKIFIGCDFSAIEARDTAWLAGEEPVLEIFRGHGKIYEYAAAGIYGVPMIQIKKDDQRRQVGKVATLALGFQGGVGAFQTMARGYGIKMAPVFGILWEAAPLEVRERAESQWTMNQGKYSISREEYLASEITKINWRANNPAIVRYWYDLENAAASAIQNPGLIFKAGAKGREVAYRVKGSFLWARLPSGRVICYPYPQMAEILTPWKEKKLAISYMAEHPVTRKWTRVHAYGGLLCENNAQAVARDLMAEAIKRLEVAKYEVVLTVHDEGLCEVDESFGSVSEMEKIMSIVPAWATGLPVAAQGFRAKRYQKG